MWLIIITISIEAVAMLLGCKSTREDKTSKSAIFVIELNFAEGMHGAEASYPMVRFIT